MANIDGPVQIRCVSCDARFRFPHGLHSEQGKAALKQMIQGHRCPPGTDRDAFRHEQERWTLGYRPDEPMPFERVKDEMSTPAERRAIALGSGEDPRV